MEWESTDDKQSIQYIRDNWSLARTTFVQTRACIRLVGLEKLEAYPVLGSSMRRIGFAATFAALGLASLWWWSAADAEICWRFPQLYVPSGCKEIGACAVGFWDGVVFLAAILGPSIAFGVVAVFFAGKRRRWTQWAVVAGGLVAAHWFVMLAFRLI